MIVADTSRQLSGSHPSNQSSSGLVRQGSVTIWRRSLDQLQRPSSFAKR